MKERLKQIVADTIGLAAEDVTDDASMETLELWDSMAHMNIVMSVEHAFEISIPIEKILDVTSIESIEETIRSLKNDA